MAFTFEALFKLCKIIIIGIKFAESYLIQPGACAQENVMLLRLRSFLSCAHYSVFDLKDLQVASLT